MNKWMHEWMNKWINEWMIAQMHSGSETDSLLRFQCEIELWRQSRAHFADLIFQKSSEHVCFSSFMWDRAFPTVLCTFCPKLLQIEARNRRNRDPTSATTETHNPKKKHRVSRARVFSNLNSRVPEMLHSPTIRWWCGWHDGDKCWPWHLPVARKLSN